MREEKILDLKLLKIAAGENDTEASALPPPQRKDGKRLGAFSGCERAEARVEAVSEGTDSEVQAWPPPRRKDVAKLGGAGKHGKAGRFCQMERGLT